VIQRYAVPPNEMFDVDAVDTTEMDPKNLRQVVDYPTTQQPGTIIVDPHKRFLYLMMGNGQALRYGVGVGKAGLEFSGTATVQAKKPWPRWTPTPDMIRREPVAIGHGPKAWRADQEIRSALARFIFSKMARIRCTASMAPPSREASERLYHPVAFAC
jgi:hypothetical protein